MWRLALPPGATMDHPFANPFAPDAVPFDRLGGSDGGAFPPSARRRPRPGRAA